MLTTHIRQNVSPDHLKKNVLGIVICDLNNHISTVAARKCIDSIRNTDSKIQPLMMQATTPETLDKHLSEFGLTKNDWTYPKIPNKRVIDIKTGLTITGYNAKDLNKVIACTASHLRVWSYCYMTDLPVVVLEHDALFTRKFDPFFVFDNYNKKNDFWEAGIVGLNDPRGATRKADNYLRRLLDSRTETGIELLPAPWADDDDKAPQGIAGNSAYMITPNAALKLIQKTEEIGLWPNDALICKQFFPFLKQAYPFYTTLQGVPSTTKG